MGRPHRSDTVGGWYHVVNRGLARQPIFLDVRDRVEFERLLGVAYERFGMRVHAYCLMTNHFHLLVECPDGGLSDSMQLIGSVYVRHLNDRLGRDGPLFRDRFYAKAVTSDAYLVRLVRYIHRNPLAFVAPQQLRAYRWSSLRAHLGDRRPPRWLQTRDVAALCGGTSGLLAMTLGDDRPPSVEHADGWWSAIDLMLDEHLGEGSRQGASRTIGALLLDRLDGPERERLAGLLAFPSGQAERSARSRARRRARAHPELEAVAAAVLDLVA